VVAKAGQQIIETLWPPGSPASGVWVILDAARDPRIYGAVEGTFLEKCCLFAGDLPWQLQMTAPYLVHLRSDDRLTRAIAEQGFGRAWGIFFRSDAGIKNLRRHFRGFLRVKDQRNRRLLFRYYDPRVMRLYLPTCTRPELETVFGPVKEYLLEDEDGRLVSYRIEGGSLKTGDGAMR
jgi:hypothetical protein